MWPDRVSNPGPLTYESGALPTVLRGPACIVTTMLEQTRVCLCRYDFVYCKFISSKDNTKGEGGGGEWFGL